MKVYNKIIYDKNNNIIYEDSYNYNGPVAKADSEDIKTAVVIGAVATGVGFFAGTLGTGAIASGLTKYMSAGMATFVASAGTSLVLSSVSRKFAPEVPDLPNLSTALSSDTRTHKTI